MEDLYSANVSQQNVISALKSKSNPKVVAINKTIIIYYYFDLLEKYWGRGGCNGAELKVIQREHPLFRALEAPIVVHIFPFGTNSNRDKTLGPPLQFKPRFHHKSKSTTN